MGLFDFFKFAKAGSPRNQKPTWDPDTLTMQQPASPPAPVAERGAGRSDAQENTRVKLRGGGGGDICCGVSVSYAFPFSSGWGLWMES
ncbi:hypothetical protein BDV28DRAFT_129372 [Aspergillus coremiiformis]|uniref:Uncharacterized protein n=1 Tax=Aspergillus coremiiformis TaxID=138285 RepID=A0A5N6ZC57_9EURO|nr:hypothetical protein BDV28DRAFT_129372 [Aspergillus coremiiformis]